VGRPCWTQDQVETPADDYYQLTGVSVLGSGTAFAVGWSQTSHVNSLAEVLLLIRF
jgi:hypothetical protein